MLLKTTRSVWMFAVAKKAAGGGRESFAAKAIIASSIEVFEARFQQHRYQEKVAKKSLSMLR